jgi:exodeoxyribonuclease V alpha subunit
MNAMSQHKTPLDKKRHLEQLIADAKAKVAALKKPEPEPVVVVPTPAPVPTVILPTPMAVAVQNALATAGIQLNAQQQEAVTRALAGESFNLIGKAGTGKTTATRIVVDEMLKAGKIGPLTEDTKVLKKGAPGFVVCSFTNRAVKNIAKGMPKDLQGNAVTIHKLIEFEPEKYEVETAEGDWVTKMRFAPKRNRYNPLPSSLKLIIFEESSMVSVELYNQLLEALPHECQFIFLGDLQQLPPVYGSAILGFKLLELPVIELTEIYRQAGDSPIISFAWKIANGEPIPASEFEKLAVPGKLNIRPWKKRLGSEDALHIISKLFHQLIDQGVYNPDEDMVMIPFNKQFGTDEFNRNIAQHLGVKRGAEVYEIIAGFQKHYYAVGDKVLVEKQEAIVREIVINGRYHGQLPLRPSTILNRWGMYNMDHPDAPKIEEEDPEAALAAVESFLAQTSSKDDDETRQQASHILKCQIIGSESFVELSTAGEYSASSFSYALTVHKCQGSEWRKCFLLLHKSHAVMLSRELLYTAVTRARESLFIFCEPDSLVKGVATQRIKGNTIAEKAEYFKGKIEENNGFLGGKKK